ncbi:MAG: LapA family protein [Candidatus Delongbacteria bacterium]|nr:LapA family protein [Candidatus Delongbacteria bacterium]
MWTLRWILFIVLLFLVLGFAILNSGQIVNLNLFWSKYESISLVLALFASFMLGVVFWFLVTVLQHLTLRKDNRVLRHRVQSLREELRDLRNASFSDTEPTDNKQLQETP